MNFEFSLVGIVGVLTFTVSALSKIIGHPDQVRKNHLRRSTEGVSTKFYILAFSSYILWTMHGLLMKDWVVVAGQFLGVITTGTILFQIFKFRK